MALLAASALIVAGCASQSAPPAASQKPAETKATYRLPAGAKVALKQGGPERTTMVRDVPASDNQSFCQAGLDNGGSAMVLNPFLMTGWAVVCAAEKAMADPSVARRVHYVRLREPAAKGFAQSLSELRPLSERVEGYARLRGLGEFAEAGDRSPRSPLDEPRHREAPGYVFELGVADVELHRRGERDIYYLRLTAEGRLVQLDDNRVVDRFTARIDSPNTIVTKWDSGSWKRFSPDLDYVLDKLAKRVVNEWMEPTLQESNELARGHDSDESLVFNLDEQ